MRSRVDRVLLDTHLWIWYLIGDSRLSPNQKHIIEELGVELWLSAVSIWEAHLLIERNRLPIKISPDAWIGQALAALTVREAPVTFRIAVLSRRLNLPHNDPADRFIAATAAGMDIPLLTADENLLASTVIRCVGPRS